MKHAGRPYLPSHMKTLGGFLANATLSHLPRGHLLPYESGEGEFDGDEENSQPTKNSQYANAIAGVEAKAGGGYLHPKDDPHHPHQVILDAGGLAVRAGIFHWGGVSNADRSSEHQFPQIKLVCDDSAISHAYLKIAKPLGTLQSPMCQAHLNEVSESFYRFRRLASLDGELSRKKSKRFKNEARLLPVQTADINAPSTAILDQLLSLRSGWDGPNSVPPTSETRRSLVSVVGCVAERIPSAEIEVDPDSGQISFAWYGRDNSSVVTVHIQPSGKVVLIQARMGTSSKITPWTSDRLTALPRALTDALDDRE